MAKGVVVVSFEAQLVALNIDVAQSILTSNIRIIGILGRLAKSLNNTEALEAALKALQETADSSKKLEQKLELFKLEGGNGN